MQSIIYSVLRTWYHRGIFFRHKKNDHKNSLFLLYLDGGESLLNGRELQSSVPGSTKWDICSPAGCHIPHQQLGTPMIIVRRSCPGSCVWDSALQEIYGE